MHIKGLECRWCWAAIAGLFLAIGCAKAPRPANVAHGDGVTGDVARNTAIARAATDRAFGLIQKAKYAEAESNLKQALEADPMYGPACNDMGVVYYRTNRLYESAWQFENAIKLMPGQPEPHNNLGLVMEQAGKMNEALRAYTAATRLAPDNAEYLGNLARARLRMGLRDEETRKLLEELLLKDSRPDWVDWAHTNLLRLRGSILEEGPTTRTSPATAP